MSRSFLIEKGVPIPPAHIQRNDLRDLPLAALEVGDSIALDGGLRQLVAVRVNRFEAQHYGWQFTTRAVPGGIRVWRTA